MVLYVDDILLASNNSDLLIEKNTCYLAIFDMKDLGETSYILEYEFFKI